MRAIFVILVALAILPGCAAGWRQGAGRGDDDGQDGPGGANAPSKSENYDRFGV